MAGVAVGGVRFLVVAAWQARMVRGAGVWALARRGADGAREVVCVGTAAEALGAEAGRSEGWREGLAAGADEFLFTVGVRDAASRAVLCARVRASAPGAAAAGAGLPERVAMAS